MADTAVDENNKVLAFRGKSKTKNAAPLKEPPVGDASVKSLPDHVTKRAKKLLRAGAISQKQHDKMVGTFVPAPVNVATGDPELNMWPD